MTKGLRGMQPDMSLLSWMAMDGGHKKGKPRLFGHHAGSKRVRQGGQSCPRLGVKYLTIFAFSTGIGSAHKKRWQVVGPVLEYILKEANNLKKNGVRVRFIGDRVRLEEPLFDLMDNLKCSRVTMISSI